MSVLVVGSLNMDLVVTMTKFPDSGQTVVARDLQMIPGGKGLNQAIAASQVGAQVSMLGCMGSDDYSRQLEEILSKFHIDTTNLQKVDGSSGVALVEVENSGSNRIAIVPGANEKFDYHAIEADYFARFGNSVVLGPLENPIMHLEKSFIAAKSAGATTILNPAPSQLLSSDFLGAVDILIPNQNEAEELSGVSIADKKDAEKAARRLLELGPQIVIITLGEKGALLVSNQENYFQEAFKIKVIDTTAAGDTFCGAFAAEIDRDQEPKLALRLASAAAALSTTKYGASHSIPGRSEINDFLKTH